MQLIFTTSRRLDLFQRTVRSIGQLADAPLITQIVVIDEGSTDEDVNAMAITLADCLPKREIIFDHSPTLRGYRKQWQTWLNCAKDDFIFHCEDDWEFREAGACLQAALDILNHDPSLIQVAFTYPRTDAPRKVTPKGTGYWVRESWGRPDLMPLTFNPCVFRLAAFRSVGDIGPELHVEYQYGLRVAAAGWRTAYLERRVAFHIGENRSAFLINHAYR
jgi:hypothetical protein